MTEGGLNTYEVYEIFQNDEELEAWKQSHYGRDQYGGHTYNGETVYSTDVIQAVIDLERWKLGPIILYAIRTYKA